MKRTITSLIGFSIFLLLPQWLMATHYRGSELSYAHVGGNTYTITITEYLDCGGITGPNPSLNGVLGFNWIAGCVGTLPQAMGAGWTLASNEEITPLYFSVIPGGATDCSGMPGTVIPGVRRLVFTRDYDFTGVGNCPIEIGYTGCCRSSALTNLSSPGSQGFYSWLQIWDYTPNNTSPEFLEPSYAMFDGQDPSYWSLTAADQEGDSLVYSPDTIYSAYNTPVNYAIGYDLYSPYGSNGHYIFDSRTGGWGIETWGSVPLGEFANAIQIKEYKNGVLQSIVSRDFTLSRIGLVGTADSNPVLETNFGPLQPTGASYQDSTVLLATAGVPISLPLQALDFPAGNVTIKWSENLPGATFTDLATGTMIDSVTGIDPVAVLNWTPPAAGHYAFNVKLRDDTPFITGNADYSLLIIASPGNVVVDLGPDSTTICEGDSLLLSPQLNYGTPPYTYLWSTGDTTGTLMVTQAGLYTITVLDAQGNTAADSIQVQFPSLVANAGPDLDFCAGSGNGILQGNPVAGASYLWTPNVHLSDNTLPMPAFTGPPGTFEYVLEMTDGTACVTSDTMSLTAHPDSLTGPLLSIAGPDTICLGDTITVNYTGPTGAGISITPNWGAATVLSGSGAGPFSLVYNTPGSFLIHFSITDGICTAEDSLYISVPPACVWPGDADNDGVADNNDLLAIGLLYGSTGIQRPNGSLQWTGQPNHFWNDTLPNGVDAVYTDTDGNGVINDDDTLAISLNYGLMHNKGDGSKGGPGDPPLFLAADLDTVPTGAQLNLPIILGVDTLQAQNIYGFAFTINYDPTLVDSGSISIAYNGWLGTYGTNLLGIQKDDYLNGKVDLAMTRTDLLPETGYGAVANISIVMIDDIAGKTAIAEDLVLSISNIRVIGADGIETPVDPRPTTLTITDESPLSLANSLGTSLRIYPQPSHDHLYIETGEAQPWEATLFTLSGQQVRHLPTQYRSREQLPLHGLAPGLYLLRVRNAQGLALRKVEVR